MVGDVNLSLVLGEIGTIYGILNKFGFNASADIIPSQSDLVVSVKSQAGGLFPPASSTFNHLHTAATTEEVVNKTVELLNKPSDDSLFVAGFPVNQWSEF